MNHIQSMTGYGAAKFELKSTGYLVELKSLNSKSLDLTLRLPQQFKFLEHDMRLQIGKYCERGKIELLVQPLHASSEAHPVIDRNAAQHYLIEIQNLCKDLNLTCNDPLPLLLRQSDLWNSNVLPEETEIRSAVMTTLETAIGRFIEFRQQEGLKLEHAIVKHIETIELLLKTIIANDPVRLNAIRDRLQNFFKRFEADLTIDAGRFELEVLLYLEKLDIHEEQVRLDAHVQYFKSTLLEPAAGRKLGFITQEMGREINTMGSKAQDAGLQKQVVEMKDALEKIKEQCANLL